MPKITRETANHFRTLATLARQRNRALRQRAHQLARSVLSKDPRIHSKERIAVQLSLMHDCIIASMGHVERGSTKGVKLRELIEAQAVLLAQADKLAGERPLDSGLEGVLHEDPEVALQGVKEAVEERDKCVPL